MLKMGDAIRLQREHIGLSQSGLAAQLALTRQAVSNWERDLSYPDADMLVQLSTVLNCDVRVLLGIKQRVEWQGWLRTRLQDVQEIMVLPKGTPQPDVVAVAKQYIKELYGLLRHEPNPTPQLLDITDVLAQVYRKLDTAKNPVALLNRMVNYIRVKAKAGYYIFPKPQESLLGELAWFGAKAGWNGAYMSDFSDKRQFYGLLERMPRRD
ncbi:helix-turn-helix domain-containing protein [Lacticaseibacillus porcinae]|uniref:helix-turn-helix domain-containing protein n=1 Tax=Lacticaseibacillus porcinae TaxID=1123687 RepID=UPI000F778CB7|nr:helix-turn-helix domain-containing protein [Lacticaseibacillus porcinae]